MLRTSCLDPIFKSLRTLLRLQIDALAAHLQIPSDWLLQFLNSNVELPVDKATGASKSANSLLQYLMFMGILPPMSIKEVMQLMASGTAPGQTGQLLADLLSFSGRLNSYYDLFSALCHPEMIGKPDHWIADPFSANPTTKAAFKRFIRSTVPKEHHRLIFGQAAS